MTVTGHGLIERYSKEIINRNRSNNCHRAVYNTALCIRICNSKVFDECVFIYQGANEQREKYALHLIH